MVTCSDFSHAGTKSSGFLSVLFLIMELRRHYRCTRQDSFTLPNRDHLEAEWCKAGVGEWDLGFELQLHHLIAGEPCPCHLRHFSSWRESSSTCQEAESWRWRKLRSLFRPNFHSKQEPLLGFFLFFVERRPIIFCLKFCNACDLCLFLSGHNKACFPNLSEELKAAIYMIAKAWQALFSWFYRLLPPPFALRSY